ncbi:MAG: ribonuclease Z [Nanoarchaeota archaeon]
MPSQIKVTFLGTSDQIPSADRNHTAILLSYEGENILIDCGEGTQRQFRKAGLNPCKLTRILITHWHGDHVLGIPGILSTLALQGYNKTLHIYGPKGTKEFMEELLKVFGFKKKYEIKVEEVHGKFLDMKDFYLEAEKMEHGIPCNSYNFVKKGFLKIDKTKLKKLKLPEGSHLAELKNGKDIVFNGKKYKAKELTFSENEKKVSVILDTKFNSKIEEFSKNSDLLILESSFSDELAEQAKEHLHMTAKQAAQAAKKAKAKKLILTHLSQRYEKAPQIILKEAKKIFGSVAIAKDFDVFEV